MMTKHVRFSLLLFIVMLSIPPRLIGVEWTCQWDAFLSDLTIKGRIAYFQPESTLVRDIYLDAWADYQLEISAPFQENFEAWANIDWMSEKGSSIGLSDETKLRLLPVSAGVSYTFKLLRSSCYVGAGICFSNLWIEDRLGSRKDYIRKRHIGALFKSGTKYYLNKTTFLEGFLDYFYQHFNLSPHDSSYAFGKRNLNLSGWKLGGGFGTKF